MHEMYLNFGLNLSTSIVVSCSKIFLSTTPNNLMFVSRVSTEIVNAVGTLRRYGIYEEMFQTESF